MTAICDRWVTHMTCLVFDTWRSFTPIFWAARPLTPVSISSNIIVGVSSFSATTFFIASIIRESSPPEAIFAIGFGGSPAFTDIISSITSIPFAVSLPFSCLKSIFTLGISRNFSSSAIFSVNLPDAAERASESFSAFSDTSARSLFLAFVRSCISLAQPAISLASPL